MKNFQRYTPKGGYGTVNDKFTRVKSKRGKKQP